MPILHIAILQNSHVNKHHISLLCDSISAYNSHRLSIIFHLKVIFIF